MSKKKIMSKTPSVANELEYLRFAASDRKDVYNLEIQVGGFRAGISLRKGDSMSWVIGQLRKLIDMLENQNRG